MQLVHDPRPHTELSDLEIVAELFRAIRNRELRTSAQVRLVAEDLFPGLPEERLKRCCADLAQRLAP